MPNTRGSDLAARLKAARETLGLPSQASCRQVQEAYHRLGRQHHPDLGSAAGRIEATERMKRINAAYEVLKHYMEQVPIPLEPDPDQLAAFDPEAWWRDRFATPYDHQ